MLRARKVLILQYNLYLSVVCSFWPMSVFDLISVSFLFHFNMNRPICWGHLTSTSRSLWWRTTCELKWSRTRLMHKDPPAEAVQWAVDEQQPTSVSMDCDEPLKVKKKPSVFGCVKVALCSWHLRLTDCSSHIVTGWKGDLVEDKLQRVHILVMRTSPLGAFCMWDQHFTARDWNTPFVRVERGWVISSLLWNDLIRSFFITAVSKCLFFDFKTITLIII